MSQPGRVFDRLTVALCGVAAAMLLLAFVNTHDRAPARDPVNPPPERLTAKDSAEWLRESAEAKRRAFFYDIAQQGQRVGPADAEVTLITYSRYGCSACKQFDVVLDQLRERYPDQVAVVYKHFLPTLAPAEVPIHIAAECAADQGRFDQYRHLAFTTAALFQEREGWLRLGDSAGVPDRAAFARCVRTEQHRDRLRHDTDEARSLGVGATPTTYLNGHRILGAVSFEALDSVTRAVLRRASAQ